MNPVCLECGSIVAIDGAPGDATVCMTCGHVMVFDADGGLREMTYAEMRAVGANPDLINLIRSRFPHREKKP